MTRSSDAALRALEACNDAIFESERWPSALQQLGESLGATSCAIRTRDDSHPFRVDQRTTTVPAPDSTEHMEFRAIWLARVDNAPDPHPTRLRRMGGPPVCFIVEDQVSTAEERARLPFYQEIARPGHREWWATVRFPVLGRPWSLNVYREAKRGPFHAGDAPRFLSIVPQLRRIVEASERMREVSLRPTLAALERSGCAAALLDHSGTVLRLNPSAEHLLEAGLALYHRRLRARDRASDVRLQALIRSCLANPFRATEAAPGPVLVRHEGVPKLLIEAMPLTALGLQYFAGVGLLLFLTDLASRHSPLEALLAKEFLLTPAETRLCKLLSEGMGISVASSMLGIGRETARSQLRAVFAKTGTSRQAELAALLTRVSRHRPS